MGELEDIAVGDLIYLLALRTQSGKVTVTANAEEVGLYFDQGQLVLVTSANSALRLGRMFVRLGIVTHEQLRDALREQELYGHRRTLGSILVLRGWITAEELARCLEEQSIEILARVIAARHGSFLYSRDTPIPARAEIVPLNADRIVMEATRRTDELTTLRALLPSASAPLVVNDRVADEVETLTDTEVLVVATLQSGSGSLVELSEQLAMDELLLWRTVLSLRERGLLIAGSR